MHRISAWLRHKMAQPYYTSVPDPDGWLTVQVDCGELLDNLQRVLGPARHPSKYYYFKH